jgi:hypothetical protein
VPEPRRKARQRQTKPKRARSKKQTTGSKRFNYDVDDPPCMNFEGIREFLGHSPLPRKTAKIWNTFDKVWDLYWGKDDSNIKRGSGWTQKYRQGYHKALDLLFVSDGSDSSDSLSGLLTKELRTLFEYYCTCIPATCPGRWIAPNGGSQDTATWLAFLRDGTQDGHATSPDEHPNEDNSWAWIRRSFKWDQMFKICARDVVVLEEIEELIRKRRILRFRCYDGSHRELTYFQDDELAQISAGELRKAREKRRRELERLNAESLKPRIMLQELARAKKLEEKRRMDDELRELNEELIRKRMRARHREEEERQSRWQRNYRVIKERFTPLQIFQRKFPRGRPSNSSSDDDSDNPLSFRNVRKAVKRGRWEMEN